MKRVAKDKPVRAAKRDLFAEIKEGVAALAQARTGARTLRTPALEFKPAPELTPVHLVSIRERLKLSR